MDERTKETAQHVQGAEEHPPQPPTVYIPACGALCDVFWWARRSPSTPPEE
ncbi:MAG TPA: hypothetical protein VKR29_10375 [Candidatus Binataceae bacterium]|nr:hypothetical protein [Candidatus Binataceae bacterium]